MTTLAISTTLKLSTNRAELLGILNACNGAINARSLKPILMCVKLIADDDRVTVVASDMEVSVRHTTTFCVIDQVGEICLPADALRDIVGELSDDMIGITVENDRAKVSDKDGYSNLYTQKADDFPLVADDPSEADIELKGGELLQLIERTSFAATQDETRNGYKGTLFDFVDGTLSLVTTDGRRIAIARINAPAITKHGIVPAKCTKILEGLIQDSEEDVSINLTTNGITFRTESWLLSSNLLEGEFPQYASVIPVGSDKRLIVSAAEMASKIRRTALMCSEESKAVRFDLSPLGGAMLSAATAGKGDANHRMSCKYEGEEMSIGVNHEFALEGVKACGADEIVWELSSPTRPIVFKIADPNWIYLVQPIALKGSA